MRKLIRYLGGICFLLIVLAGFVFASKNSSEVPLWIGVQLAPQSLAVWVLLAFAWGGMLGLLIGFGLFRRLRSNYKIHQLEARLKKLEEGKAGQGLKAGNLKGHEYD
jgi:putative membrane protein